MNSKITSIPPLSYHKKQRGSQAYKTGLAAESNAARYFQEHGFIILAQRRRTPCGEIDLIVANENYLIAVEVKQRTTLTDARYALSPRQGQRLLRSFHFLIETQPQWHRPNIRFDVIIVDAAGTLRHIEDALRLY